MAQTNSQKMAQAAYKRIADRKPDREFVSFARSFPSLIHSCGLAQAVAFANVKGAAEKAKRRNRPANTLTTSPQSSRSSAIPTLPRQTNSRRRPGMPLCRSMCA